MTAERQRPTGIDVIPQELRDLPQWLGWIQVDKGGPKPTKIPKQLSGENASTTDPATWATFDAIIDGYTAKLFAGVGIVISKPYTGIDLDKCRDPQTGKIEQWALEIVDRLNSYTEVSPNRTGLHIWVKAEKPGTNTRQGNLEMYDHQSPRYFTVTAAHLPGTPLTIADRQEELAALYREIWPEQAEGRPARSIPARVVSLFADDNQLLEKARTNEITGADFVALYDRGDTSDYEGDHSKADWSLVKSLAFWSGGDANRVDRLFRGSALFRAKWDEVHYKNGDTYGKHTIDEALRGARLYDPTFYTANRPLEIVTIGRNGVRHADDEEESLPPFPLDALPAAFADFAEEGARSIGVPIEFLAVPLLVVAGAAIGDSLEIAIKSDYLEGSNLYCAVVGRPGTAKSPALGKVVESIKIAELRRHRIWKDAMRDYEEQLQAYEAGKRGQRGERPVEPILRDLFTTNATVEALIAMLERHNGILYYADELAGLLSGLNQYKNGRGSDRQTYLQFWARTFHANHRKKDGEHTIIDRPHVSLLGGIQPGVLKNLDTGEGNDGLPDRFLWVYPETTIGPVSRDVLSASTTDRVNDIVWRLIDASDQERQTVTLHEDAWTVWEAGVNKWNADLNDKRFANTYGGLWSKLGAQLSRIALILHAIEDGGDVVQPRTMANALQIVMCVAEHGRKVYSANRHLGGNREIRILEALHGGGKLKQSEIVRKVFGGHDSSAVRDALEGLKESALVTDEWVETGGRNARFWRRL